MKTINVGSSSGSARFTVASRIPLKQLRSMGGTYLYDQQRTSYGRYDDNNDEFNVEFIKILFILE